MKKKETKELTLKSPEELQVMLGKVRKELAKIILEIKSGRMKNVSLARNKKKDIAKILTVIRDKELNKI